MSNFNVLFKISFNMSNFNVLFKISFNTNGILQ